jgi:hypothetical protein
MTASVVRYFRLRTGAALVALFVQWLAMAASADELADFHAAIVQASGQYRLAMTALELSGREQTAAAVGRFRESWQIVIDRFASNRPALFADHDRYGTILMQVDTRIVGALIVIDVGSREAAREALAPIAETLSQLIAQSDPSLR